MQTPLYAVLTGDIVKSSRMSPADLKRLPDVLTTIFESIDTICKPADFVTQFSIFRGDGFQVICKPACAIKAWLLIRAGLRSAYPAPLSKTVDSRTGIAVGKVNHLAKNITESSGEAFNLSGRLLEELKAPRLTGFASANEQVNREFNIHLLLADDIIRRWTTAQSLLVPLLLQSMSQDRIAQATHTRQPTVTAKVNAMGWNAIEAWTNYFMEIIEKGSKFSSD
ncbi:MAG: hypothetical protein RBR28_12215 [Lentimicrobium sp.]|jgi:hypothetical protein|nr:hypothetical protein [Lentimicrobium sp.]